jgi:hypothetical protein
MKLRDYLIGYLRTGLLPIPVPYRTKRPILEGWSHLRVTEDTLDQYFPTEKASVGILLGDPSKGLVDIDLDCPEARMAAPYLLPPTPYLRAAQ